MAGAGMWSAVKSIVNAAVGSSDGISAAVKANIGDVANSFAKNASLKSFNGLNFTANDAFKYTYEGVSKEIAKGAKVTAGSFGEMQAIFKELDSMGGEMLTSGNLLKNASGAITNQEAIDSAIKNFHNVRSRAASGAYSGMSDLSQIMGDTDLMKLAGREGKKNLGLGFITSGYFGDEANGAIRKKVALGGYAAGAIGLRTLQGGDLTHNARGENDIAGIPFF